MMIKIKQREKEKEKEMVQNEEEDRTRLCAHVCVYTQSTGEKINANRISDLKQKVNGQKNSS